MSKYDKVMCPLCDTVMIINPVSQQNVKTLLVCFNKDCDTVLESENDIHWWREQLRKESQEEESSKYGGKRKDENANSRLKAGQQRNSRSITSHLPTSTAIRKVSRLRGRNG
jgi:hypothetical protein